MYSLQQKRIEQLDILWNSSSVIINNVASVTDIKCQILWIFIHQVPSHFIKITEFDALTVTYNDTHKINNFVHFFFFFF